MGDSQPDTLYGGISAVTKFATVVRAGAIPPGALARTETWREEIRVMTQQNNGNTGNRGMGSREKDKDKNKETSRDDSLQNTRADHTNENSRGFEGSRNSGGGERGDMDQSQHRSQMSDPTLQDDPDRDTYREER